MGVRSPVKKQRFKWHRKKYPSNKKVFVKETKLFFHFPLRLEAQKGTLKTECPLLYIYRGRFFWQSITLSATVIIYSAVRGKTGDLLAMRKQLIPALPWIALTMFFVFLTNTLLQKALQIGLVSKVKLVMSFNIALGVPLTLGIDKIFPGTFGYDLPKQKTVWVVRFIGVILIIISIALLID